MVTVDTRPFRTSSLVALSPFLRILWLEWIRAWLGICTLAVRLAVRLILDFFGEWRNVQLLDAERNVAF
jgi:hypothetical protein